MVPSEGGAGRDPATELGSKGNGGIREQRPAGSCQPSEARRLGASLMVQWLRLHAPNAGGPGSIPGQETRFPDAKTKTWCSQINK